MNGFAKQSFFELFDSGLIYSLASEFEYDSVLNVAPPDEIKLACQDIEASMFSALNDFLIDCIDLKLPVNNPISFFYRFFEKRESLLKNDNTADIARHLLKMVYADSGVLFGSSFTSTTDHRSAIRVADLFWLASQKGVWENIEKNEDKSLFTIEAEMEDGTSADLIEVAAAMQSRLINARSFDEDKLYFEELIQELCEQKDEYCAWSRMADLEGEEYVCRSLSKEKCLKFFEIYYFFSMMQHADKSRKVKEKKRLEDLKKNLETAYMLARFLVAIKKFDQWKQNPPRDSISNSYLEREKTLFCLLRDYFRKNRIWISALAKVKGKSEELELSLQTYYSELKSCKKGETQDLIEAEKAVLQDIAQHPFVFCIIELQKELARPSVKKVVAYFLFDIFNHAGNVEAPFMRASYKCCCQNKQLQTEPMSTDATAVRKQKNAIYLFDALKEWSAVVFRTAYDERLCEYLFERNRGYVPHMKYFISLENVNQIVQSPIAQYRLQRWLDDRLRQNLQMDVMCFQQYATTQCTTEDFYEFFFGSSDVESKKVRKQLTKILKDDEVLFKRYCEIVLFSEEGYGTSHQPKAWHEKVALLLDEIIDKDETLCSYADGENALDDFEITSGLNYEMLKNTFIDLAGNPPEKNRYLTNHARLQLAIHAIFLKRAAKCAHREAMQLFKLFFF